MCRNIKDFLILITLIFISSCKKESDTCHYNLNPIEGSSFFITYKINDIKYTYYQIYEPSTFASESVFILNNQKVFNTYYTINFDSPGWNGAIYTYDFPTIHPFVTLLIQDTIMLNKNIITMIPIPPLSDKLKQNYKFSYPKVLIAPSEITSYDPLYFPCISLTLYINNIEYSTEFLVKHYDFNPDYLNTYLWNSSSFRISDVKKICKNLKIVSGEFTTKVSAGYNSETITISDGYFNVIIH